MEVVNFFKHLRSCFSKDEGRQKDVNVKVAERPKIFGVAQVM